MTYTFLQISKHPPELCPVYNEKYRKITLDIVDKVEAIANKHGIKFVGAWNVSPEHLVIAVYETPTIDAFQKFMVEPEMVAWNAFNSTEVKMAITLKEAGTLMTQDG